MSKSCSIQHQKKSKSIYICALKLHAYHSQFVFQIQFGSHGIRSEPKKSKALDLQHFKVVLLYRYCISRQSILRTVQMGKGKQCPNDAAGVRMNLD